MQGGVFVDATQSSNKVILERAYRTFGGVASVDTRRDELEVNSFVAQEIFECSGALVIEALELGSKSSGNKARVDALEGG